MKEQRYNPGTGINTLQEVFIARSSGKQRAGRAGRVAEGTCWRLFAETFFNNQTISGKPASGHGSELVAEYSLPEIQRIALEEVILQVLYLRLGRPEVFLLKCLSPPVSPFTCLQYIFLHIMY